MKNAILGFAMCVSLWFVEPAMACPFCDSETAKQVRSGLADGNLSASVSAVFAPFLVALGIVAAIHFRPSWSRRKS